MLRAFRYKYDPKSPFTNNVIKSVGIHRLRYTKTLKGGNEQRTTHYGKRGSQCAYRIWSVHWEGSRCCQYSPSIGLYPEQRNIITFVVSFSEEITHSYAARGPWARFIGIASENLSDLGINRFRCWCGNDYRQYCKLCFWICLELHT